MRSVVPDRVVPERMMTKRYVGIRQHPSQTGASSDRRWRNARFRAFFHSRVPVGSLGWPSVIAVRFAA
jgi:hypothetical protein